MYDKEDVQTLTDRFIECIEVRKNRKENNFNGSMQVQKMNNRKLSREEEMRKRKMDRNEYKLFYADFLKIILDF